MSFRVTEGDQALTVHLSGEIDLDRSPEARKALLSSLADGRPVVVDMGEVSYIDSSGVASLVEAYQRAKESKIDFSLQRVGERVLKVLSLARLDSIFTIVPG